MGRRSLEGATTVTSQTIKGSYIRLAYADKVKGPWTIYPPGSLQLRDSKFLTEPPEAAEVTTKVDRGRLSRSVSPGGLPHGIRVAVTTPQIASPGVKVER